MKTRVIAIFAICVLIISVLNFTSCSDKEKNTEDDSSNTGTTEKGTDEGNEDMDKTYTIYDETANAQDYAAYTRSSDVSDLRSQRYRPYWHLSPDTFELNDPNGLFYDAKDRLYHCYYQHNKSGYRIAEKDMVWEHAVSSDLVHWVNVGTAIDVIRREMAWSGSCVVDDDNTSGFFDDNTDPAQRVVAIYTGASNKNGQVQNIAYSLDGGFTFNSYENNPVLSDGYRGDANFRDPKVSKYYDERFKNGYIWLMVVGGGPVQLYTSENLTDWTWNSVVKDTEGEIIDSECPDLFRLPVDGNENDQKWVLSHSGSYYYLGELVLGDDNVFTFKTETKVDRFTTPNTAAFQTFYNTPDGRRIGCAWQGDMTVGYEDGFADKLFDGCHTLMMECKLVHDRNGNVVMQGYPVKEYSLMRDTVLKEITEEKFTGESGNVLGDLQSEHFDMLFDFDPAELGEFNMQLKAKGANGIFINYNAQTHILKVDMSRSSEKKNPYEAVYECELLPKADGVVSLRIICDGMSLEIYGNYGETMMENVIFSPEDALETSLTVKSGTLNIKGLKVYSMKSIFD